MFADSLCNRLICKLILIHFCNSKRHNFARKSHFANFDKD